MIFDETISYAFESESKFRLGAILVNGKRKFYGLNWMHRTHPLGLFLEKSKWVQIGVHAEMEALIKAKDLAEGSTLYVARVLRDGTPGNAEPCVRCKYLLKLAGVKKVWYTVGVDTKKHPFDVFEPKWLSAIPRLWEV